MTTKRYPKYLAAVVAAAASMASLSPHDMPFVSAVPTVQERALPPSPPRLRDQRDRKRRKPLKHVKRKAPPLRPRGASAPTAPAIDMRHDKYLNSPARGWRRFKWATAHPGEPLPKAWTEEPKVKPLPLKVQSKRRRAETYRGSASHKDLMANRKARRKQVSALYDLKPYHGYAQGEGDRPAERRRKRMARAAA